MSAATRSIQATPDAGRLFAIIAGAAVAAALLAALVYGMLAVNGAEITAPAAAPAPVPALGHDSSATGPWGPAVTDAGGHTRYGR